MPNSESSWSKSHPAERRTLATKTKSFAVENYDLGATLSSGQAFRWQPLGQAWEGVIGERWVRLRLAKRGITAEAPCPTNDWAWLEKYLDTRFDLGQAL